LAVWTGSYLRGTERDDGMASFVVKAAPRPEDADRLEFDEKTMWRGKDIRAGDDVFIFAAEHNGGRGLYARGIVTESVSGAGSRVSLTVQCTGAATRPLGRAELRPFRDLPDAGPETEIDRKLYRQATNKIAGISDAAVAFLRGFFREAASDRYRNGVRGIRLASEIKDAKIK
jgi:hypothetical protein